MERNQEQQIMHNQRKIIEKHLKQKSVQLVKVKMRNCNFKKSSSNFNVFSAIFVFVSLHICRPVISNQESALKSLEKLKVSSLSSRKSNHLKNSCQSKDEKYVKMKMRNLISLKINIFSKLLSQKLVYWSIANSLQNNLEV